MDWKHLLSLSPHNLDDIRKDGAAQEITNIPTDLKMDGKSCKKLFRLAQVALKFRNEQVQHLQVKLMEGKEDQGSQERLQDWKRTIEKLELERHTMRTKLKQLTDENAKLLARQQAEATHFGSEGEDSPDALSEIERQQELYNNISMKNKHIKRLLRDIDDLEKRNSFQVDAINELQVSLNDATLNLTALTHQYEELKARSKELEDSIEISNEKLETLEGKIAQVTQERSALAEELDTANRQHELQLSELQRQLKSKEEAWLELKDRYDDLLSQFPGIDIEAERREYKLMEERLQQKDEVIIDLEDKLLTLSKEIYRSTEMMNRISEEKRRASKEKPKESQCCNEFRVQLERANERCREMQELLTGIEEDNCLKSRQAVEAIEALRRYENGEEGLSSALRKINRLQEKVSKRDKQIRELIAEINLAHDIALENSVLRQRLGLPDDEVVATSSILAQQKRISKVNERLAMKLRASEEMRLQLKLEKNELKRKLASLRQSPSETGEDGENAILGEALVKFCEKCMKQYNVQDSVRHCKACRFRQSFNYCDTCVGQLKMNFEDNPENQQIPIDPTEKSTKYHRMLELEKLYATVVEENENLRIGMHEILQKLREYDAMSERLTIDTSLLERILNALNDRPVSAWYHSTVRLQNELRERDMLLKERLGPTGASDSGRKSKSVQSTESVNDSGNVCNEDDNSETIDPLVEQDQGDFSEQVLLKAVEIDRLTEALDELRNENERLLAQHDELKVTETLYNELLSMTKASDSEKDRMLVQTFERLKSIESGVCALQRKVDYLKSDNDNLQNTMRTIKSEHLELLHTLRCQLARKNSELKQRQSVEGSHQNSVDRVESDSIEKLEAELARMKQEATNFYGIFLKNIQEVDKDQLLQVDLSKMNQLGVVDSNLTVEFITKDEYRKLRERLDQLERELQREATKNGHLEELLKVSNDQIRSQQSLISKYSEEEVSLRHLVVDLQSTSNEKYLLTRTHKELNAVREQEEQLKGENAKMKQRFLEKLAEVDTLKQRLEEQEEDFAARQKDNVLKIRFLKKSLQMLTQNYHSRAPTFAITEFVKLYANVLELRKSMTEERRDHLNRTREEEYERLFAKMQETVDGNHMQDKINLIKFESQSEYLTRQLILCQEQLDQLQTENQQLRLGEVENTRHWDTLELLFGDDPGRKRKDNERYFDKEVQVSVETSSKCINTIPIIDDPPVGRPSRSSSGDTIHGTDDRPEECAVGTETVEESVGQTITQKSLESQLKQAMMLASTRSALLLEAESRLSEYQGRIRLLEKSLEEKTSLLKQYEQSATTEKHDRHEDNILSATIGSLQNLLLEKDTTLSRYQELLKAERAEHSQVYDDNMAQIRNLKKSIDEMEQKLYDKQKDCNNLQAQVEELSRQKAEQESLPEKQSSAEDPTTDKEGQPAADGLVYTDKVIENIYEIDEKKERELQELQVQLRMVESNLQDTENEQKRLQLLLRETMSREKKLEKQLREKENELASVNARLSSETNNDLREFSETIATAQEIEQLKEMLEEKDRHIQDLTDTLSQFHEDQSNFMNDTSLHSAEQVSQLSADLNRSEASNRVLKTQIDALKRQIASVQQREKQSRELVKTLKNQLIKRPVIAMKTDRLTTPREDQLARRVQQLETELLDAKDELRKQTMINENRRAKTAAELDLWNKQKRWQQMAERLKGQLKEREVELEKLKVHFNTAKTTISRLERDRARLQSAGAGSNASAAATAIGPQQMLDNKYQDGSESPEQSCSTDSTVSESTSTTTHMFDANRKEIIEALKSRIEAQQRRIVAMELERKGSNTVAHELERMQEKLCSLEAQNVRLEAKTLQLQLDNDMLRQNDERDRLKRQVAHLEEYIISLKEELSKATAGCPETINFENLCIRCSRRNGSTEQEERRANLEQTVLTLQRMIDKLRAENKYLKEHRTREREQPSSGGQHGSTVAYERLKKDHEKLQSSYAEAQNKLSMQQVEIELLSSVSCTRCKVLSGGGGDLSAPVGGTANADRLEELKDKLEKKSQLLEKAKILLQRAAAKERYLKEQIDLLRRKCSDLQNVPVIDEISE
ncbi:centrosomal protein cep290 [Anopheles aquasalis]|uniref:centrosomal protein cep290 n=1 Tax=Anopheles aquasalis TaxID=42839 RepID=UPI00215A7A7E|nr:centrosomal protein cep290 [Anopheles aquasalis]